MMPLFLAQPYLKRTRHREWYMVDPKSMSCGTLQLRIGFVQMALSFGFILESLLGESLSNGSAQMIKLE